MQVIDVCNVRMYTSVRNETMRTRIECFRWSVLEKRTEFWDKKKINIINMDNICDIIFYFIRICYLCMFIKYVIKSQYILSTPSLKLQSKKKNPCNLTLNVLI